MAISIFTQVIKSSDFSQFWQELQEKFVGLPDYSSLPRTTLGRPYLAKHYPYGKQWLIDFNISNSSSYTFIGLVISDSFLPYREQVFYIGVDLEKDFTLSEKAFTRRILSPLNKADYIDSPHARALEWVSKEAIIKSFSLSIFSGNKISFHKDYIALNDSMFNLQSEDNFLLTLSNWQGFILGLCLINLPSFPTSISFNQDPLAIMPNTTHYQGIYKDSAPLLFSRIKKAT
ncbi:hypothetical protein CJP74_02680 [Psittacicella melopsittaci]|uniref:Uncharacterized protein n=1 Tax=Psittacicella melopsittaci TaxID=2028576 RepID=A0A3A1YA81_9GAMM|nr:hypothetical protein [Psittacicella melopsittaci]RIY33054.1 hypothetical protein CJP74_02680 [Psittacicella melopsittaci]